MQWSQTAVSLLFMTTCRCLLFLSSDERIETVCCLVCLKLGKLDANGQCVQLLGPIVTSCAYSLVAPGYTMKSLQSLQMYLATLCVFENYL